MKIIIIGLGNFGGHLAEKLAQRGNEVIGVDSSIDKVNAMKDKLTHAICLNATDQMALSNLPLKNSDIVMVCIGENEGANIIVTAILKNIGVNRLISRAINPLHESVLQALGVHEIVHPEAETAERWAKKLCLDGVLNSFDLNKNYSIVEVEVPKQYVGKTYEDAAFKERYNVTVLTIIKHSEQSSFLGKNKIVSNVEGAPDPNRIIAADDVLVVFGENNDLQKFVRG